MPKTKGLPHGVEYTLLSDGQKSWQVRKMVKGKKVFKKFGTGKQGELEARVFAEQVHRAKFSPDETILPSITISVEQAIKEYYISIRHLAPLTRKSKQASYKRFYAYFKDYQLRHIKSSDISNFFRKQIDYKYTSLYVLRNNVSVFFKFLKSSGYISDIPELILPVNLSYETECNKRRKPLTPEHLKIVLFSLPETWWGDAVKVLVFTGMRIGELRGLRWENVFDKYIFVKASKHFKPKSAKGERRIPLHPIAKQIIEYNKERGAEYPIPNINGGQINSSILNARWKTFRIKLSEENNIDLENTRLHDLRHTFGMLMAKSLNLPYLQKVMGHSTIKQTSYYAQQTDDLVQQEIEKNGFPF